LLLATLCQSWRVAVAPGYTPAFQPLITLRPEGGLPMTVTQRRPFHTDRPELICHESR